MPISLSTEKEFVLYGIGNPLMDIIVRAPHGAPESLGVSPGSMNLVSYEQQQAALRSGSVMRRLPGGSCANTVRGFRWLLRSMGTNAASAPAAYTGAVGSDQAGEAFAALLETEQIDPLLARKRTPTGSSVIMVTPDSQRTMFTYLGACRDLTVDDINVERVRSARIIHLTGYMWDTPNQEAAAKLAARVARGSHTIVSFDVADAYLIGRYRASLLEWIPGNVDVFFANREEAEALTQRTGDDDALLDALRALAPTVVMKLGARGCVVGHAGETHRLPAYPGERFDTTGAGDAFAAGYLYGVARKLPPGACAAIANAIAAGIVSVDGCNYDALDSDSTRESVARIEEQT